MSLLIANIFLFIYFYERFHRRLSIFIDFSLFWPTDTYPFDSHIPFAQNIISFRSRKAIKTFTLAVLAPFPSPSLCLQFCKQVIVDLSGKISENCSLMPKEYFSVPHSSDTTVKQIYISRVASCIYFWLDPSGFVYQLSCVEKPLPAIVACSRVYL